ncbi:MAG: hypothetical protein HDR56_00205 [Treponema sp.]|nr:hypothetical protein [Treponema sp.]
MIHFLKIVRAGNLQEKAKAKLAIRQIDEKIQKFSASRVHVRIVNTTIKIDTIFCELCFFTKDKTIIFNIMYNARNSATKIFLAILNFGETV